MRIKDKQNEIFLITISKGYGGLILNLFVTFSNIDRKKSIVANT